MENSKIPWERLWNISKELRMTEPEFWKCTFRKLMGLWDDYREFKGLDEGEKPKPKKKVYVNDIF